MTFLGKRAERGKKGQKGENSPLVPFRTLWSPLLPFGPLLSETTEITISMNTYRFTLERYRGISTRYTCPQCGRKHTFTKYIDTENNIYIYQ